MLKILYEDKYLIACEKDIGIESENNNKEDCLPFLLKDFSDEVFTLHRLDKPVGGAIIYAKTKAAAGAFSKLIAQDGIEKTYLAAVEGIPEKSSDELCDLLFKDSRKNKTFVVKRLRKGVKEAKLKYEVISTASNISLLKIKLITGRSHQIRVQFASRKMPLCGDGKYGSKDNKCTIALWSHSLEFTHPFTKEQIKIQCEPNFEDYPWKTFKTK